MIAIKIDPNGKVTQIAVPDNPEEHARVTRVYLKGQPRNFRLSNNRVLRSSNKGAENVVAGKLVSTPVKGIVLVIGRNMSGLSRDQINKTMGELRKN
ncbi:hypothetical protein [Alkalihalobacillus sp. TS-13]|uniref:hypothetical protein n=1 Tax=Alkalihalobacillus sp. TS-13 TaxID=2842455 RepID=UPI001C87DACB|nr:hypothetical protein [Alkalihalobacillus sp. TS-13]